MKAINENYHVINFINLNLISLFTVFVFTYITVIYNSCAIWNEHVIQG